MWGYLSIPLGYMLGSIPTTFIIGKALSRIDLCTEGDGHISATAVYRKIGLFPFIINIIIDVGKGAAAVLLAGLITQELLLIIAAGVMAIVGHCWSVFIKFRGGLGGTVIIGTLLAFGWWQMLICLVITGVILFIVRRSTISTVLLALFMAIALYLTRTNWLAATFPVALLAVQFIKRWTVKGKSDKAEYKNNMFSDLKRVK